MKWSNIFWFLNAPLTLTGALISIWGGYFSMWLVAGIIGFVIAWVSDPHGSIQLKFPSAKKILRNLMYLTLILMILGIVFFPGFWVRILLTGLCVTAWFYFMEPDNL